MSDSKKWFVLVCAVLAGWLLYLLGPILTPFILSALLAYLGDPLVKRLQSRKLSRTPAVIVVFSGMFLFFLLMLLLLIPMLEQQIEALIGRLPAYLDWIQQTATPWLEEKLGLKEPLIDIGRLKEIITQHLAEAGGLVKSVLASVSRSGMALLGWLAGLVLLPIVTFYMLRDWDRILEYLFAFVPNRMKSKVLRWARESDEVLGAFLRGQLLVMLALGVIYSLGLWIIGLDLALLMGMAAGLLSFVPYLGFAVGILTAGTAALVQGGGLMKLLAVALVFAIGQALEGMVLTPRLVGERIGLHPVVVILVLLAGGQLFGFVGLLLALPASAVGAVAVRHAYEEYVDSQFYKK